MKVPSVEDLPSTGAKRGSPLARTVGLRKTYRSGKASVEALAGIDLEIHAGDYLAISGPSGCGKSTLMAMLGALDRPTEGSVFIRGVDITTLDDAGLSEMRSRIGFVFQSFNLFQNLTAVENVELGMSISNVPRTYRRATAKHVLDLVDLGDRIDNQPRELSGGEQQRVAIARALARDPAYLLMDEPTGNLDSKSVTEVLKLIRNLNRQGTTIVMVTHDQGVARQAGRSISMLDGRIDSRSRLIRVNQRNQHVRQ
jgi:putative ABC transport system ATP-binding protein